MKMNVLVLAHEKKKAVKAKKLREAQLVLVRGK